ncbi:hypothetical protein Asera_57050 [Actinocatenispora sera]|uniref:Uncharacterized protein n=1 Tax=Actinocatenispora sera TaxID=390989 RepID=A0A810L8N2_9ACTN|nr:hypothetical protein Asera_57050 [Actinocatenispora sera]
MTLAGPLGFVGLCAPALARPLARRFPLPHRSWAFLGVAGLTGTAVVLGSDVLLRAAVSGRTRWRSRPVWSPAGSARCS